MKAEISTLPHCPTEHRHVRVSGARVIARKRPTATLMLREHGVCVDCGANVARLSPIHDIGAWKANAAKCDGESVLLCVAAKRRSA